MNENQKRPPQKEGGRSGTNCPEHSFTPTKRTSAGLGAHSDVDRYWNHLMAKDAAVMARRCRCERTT